MDKSATTSPTVAWLVNASKTRALPAVVLAPLGLWIVYIGGWVYFLFCPLILGIAVF